MNVAQTIDRLRRDDRFMRNLTQWRSIPAREARYAGFPEGLHPRLIEGLKARGITDLYTHQRAAIEAVLAGEHICVVTPTASGKTLCYNAPVLNRLLSDPEARALYLFPTKALSQDQVKELQSTIEELEVKIGTYTFDGDTPGSARKAIRNAGHIVVTNPDMLHTGILPHHTIWMKLFENLRYIVVDELHHYRGVFGSHLANVLRRLKRICAFYGSDPQFICCSATIANPKEMAERIVEKPIHLIDDNGAPAGERHFLFYNPPVVNAELGIRRSSVHVATDIATQLLSKDIQSIVFTRSRLRVEIMTTYLKDAVARLGKSTDLVRGYRGGYLPTERRAIEKGLRDGEIMAVVSTNALELGIDIGSLDACIMVGYSGSVASTWQQAGRAGRRSSTSLVILVASSAPLDQYIICHPEYFFELSPENATVDTNNLFIVSSHVKCAAFEFPFKDGEAFGLDAVSTQGILEYLAEQRILRHVRDRWHWNADAYPAQDISLRTAAPGNVVILDTTQNGRVIGEIDYFSAPTEVYQNAIYLHQSAQYTIERLDLEDRKAYARPVETDYYTDAQVKVDLRVLDAFRSETVGQASRNHGEVSVTWLPSVYKKIKFGTHENVGYGDIHLPEINMHTASYWIAFPEDLSERTDLPQSRLGAALNGLANTLRQVAPVQVMCDPTDIRALGLLRSPFSEQPTIFLYETYPGGVGFSEKLFTTHDRLLEAAISLISRCGCKEGCPSCVGPALEIGGEHGKNGALILAKMALDYRER
ncbi:MAG TPA: DEAD/DEAH box helicase [Candidatus Hydrogenedentes bacterium]|nr:DEAD/DEAH box helicase [Candidatus Hydrogenedentota bacterium]HOS01758.1 DEAD/DEAH box helicase [Candidatus Hydrogenedentota bacterium]